MGGVGLDAAGSTSTMTFHHVKDADNLWWKSARSSTSRQVPLEERAGHLHSAVAVRFLWTEFWPPSRCAHDVIESAEVASSAD